MKRLLIPMLFVPSAAMAGLLIVGAPLKKEQEKKGTQIAELAGMAGSTAVSGALPAAAPKMVIVPAAPLAPKWVIERDQPIHQALEGWAKDANWTLIWYPAVSWKAISRVDMKSQKDVVAAVSEVITILRDEGKPVRLRVSDGNHVMEVLSTEVKND